MDNHNIQQGPDEFLINPFQLGRFILKDLPLILAIVSVAVAIAAGILFFGLPDLYSVKMVLQPGTNPFSDLEQESSPLWSVNDLQLWLESKGYRSELNDRYTDYSPELTIRSQQNKRSQSRQAPGSSVLVTLYDKDPNRGKKYFQEVINIAKHKQLASIQWRKTNITYKIQNKKEEIKQLEIEKERIATKLAELQRKRKQLNNALNLSNQHQEVMAEFEGQMKRLKQQIYEEYVSPGDLRNDLQNASADVLQQLLLTDFVYQGHDNKVRVLNQISRQLNEIYDEEKYRNQTKQDRSEIKRKIEQSKIQREQSIPSKISVLKNDIRELEEKRKLLSPVIVQQQPFQSLKPVRPNRTSILLLVTGLSLVFALIVSTLRGIARNVSTQT